MPTPDKGRSQAFLRACALRFRRSRPAPAGMSRDALAAEAQAAEQLPVKPVRLLGFEDASIS